MIIGYATLMGARVRQADLNYKIDKYYSRLDLVSGLVDIIGLYYFNLK